MYRKIFSINIFSIIYSYIFSAKVDGGKMREKIHTSTLNNTKFSIHVMILNRQTTLWHA